MLKMLCKRGKIHAQVCLQFRDKFSASALISITYYLLLAGFSQQGIGSRLAPPDQHTGESCLTKFHFIYHISIFISLDHITSTAVSQPAALTQTTLSFNQGRLGIAKSDTVLFKGV